jgi:AraC-like DNA-binding protein
LQYAEFEAPAALRRHVQCLWRLRDPEPAAQPQTIYPDGRCELIVHLGTPMRRYTLAHGWQTQARRLFAAQLRSAIRLAADGPVDCIGIRLQPAASAVLVGQRLSSLVDDVIDLDGIDSDFAAHLFGAAIASNADVRCADLWRLLQMRIGDLPLDARVESALAAVDAAQGDITVAALAAETNMSLRSLQTRVLAAVGLTVKEYARVQRLQATLRQLDTAAEPIAQLAAASGFSDQAHATRELQQLTGLTPARLRRALRAERDGDETLRMAAAFVRGRA